MNWKWNFRELDDIPKNNINVFTCFSCGGGSTMGYKLAGCNVIGNLEIDKNVNKIYKINHHPLYNFEMDIRDFKNIEREKLPKDLFNLDILDGSPPCSSFSMLGNRSKDWGKKKKFKEGQVDQVLDDLFFEFINVVEKLKPKIVIAENVKGLISGNAKGYVKDILKRYKEIGYETQIFLLNAALMGVPQARERVFFISRRIDLNMPKIKLKFNDKLITFGEVESKIKDIYGKKITQSLRKYYFQTPAGEDLSYSHPRGMYYSFRRLHKDKVCPTLTASSDNLINYKEPYFISDKMITTLQTFPQDYNFMDAVPRYICGMSVPPIMMKRIADEVIKQCFKKGG
jgi:DNA (cytosine-5)-methyltransferase 1